MKPMRTGGFTLLELMIGLAVAALLLSLAVPGYQQYLQRARLEEAKAALLENSHYMQRWYHENGAYHQNGPLAWPDLPARSTAAFDIGFSSAKPTAENVEQASFIIEARPKPGAGLDEWLLKVDQDGTLRQCRQEGEGEQCQR
ncbi:type IV pilin protein [Chromobacterium paludis]|uniref:Prepilin-type N-terminal cleavage/methylation domain-containing protein n=1 Tax=Chromobacterium paludis TaxID=2605945 RepID=A0A5C1DJB2_9NEIS|nr:type IV pilin protein [Chromobacterium paludis]QEL56784.1 prepilin-type N-terminal cleavage/methylation domain-containing protein [Chromobacterium paludis]